MDADQLNSLEMLKEAFKRNNTELNKIANLRPNSTFQNSDFIKTNMPS